LGWPIPVKRFVPFSVGALFVLLGSLLPRFRSNFFFGIRTPWTLSSESVWAQTHRIGGWAFALMGLLLIIAGVVGSTRWLIGAFAGSVVLALGLLVYSYLLWRAEQRPN
jgi:immunity protein, SdpI family